MEKQVFISYASKELSAAEEVCNYLEENGISCWIAPRNILPGAEYGEAIINGIENCKVFVLIYSETSNSSQHVLREVERAVSKRVPLIAYKIEDAPLSKSMEYFLLTNQWLDATTKGSHLAELARSIELLIGEKKENIEEVDIHNKKSDAGVKRLIPTICAIAGAIILIVVLSISLKDNDHKSTDDTVMAQTTPTIEPTVEVTNTIAPTQAAADENGQSENTASGSNIDNDQNADKKDSQNSEESKDLQNETPKDTSAVEQNETPKDIHDDTQGDQNQQQTLVADNTEKNNETVNPADPAQEESQVNIEVGEYISFGHYKPQGYKADNADDAISWIIVNVDKKKNEAVLLSEKVLDLKPFDVAESGAYDKDLKGNSYDRDMKDSYSLEQMVQFRGNSDWEASNIRTWLNSNAARVPYKDQAPINHATDEGVNSYDKQAGFLHGFSKSELNRLCEVKNTTTVNAIGAEKSDKPTYEYKPGLVSDSINMSKYASKTTKDKVYLLSLDEVKKYLYDNNLIIFAEPTQSAIDSDDSTYYKAFLDYDTTYCNWALRTPNGTEASKVVVVGPGIDSKQDFTSYSAYASGLGIRPAVTISLSGVTVAGEGTSESPYTLK